MKQRTRTESTAEGGRKKAAQCEKRQRNSRATKKSKAKAGSIGGPKKDEEDIHNMLKTWDTCVSEADDKLKKSLIQNDVKQVYCSSIVVVHPPEDNTSQQKLKRRAQETSNHYRKIETL